MRGCSERATAVSYAEVSVRGRSEAMALKSAAFRDWLIEGYYRACRELPSDWAIRRVLGALEAIARSEAGTPSVFVRVGHDGNSDGNGSACYLDLADPSGRAVKFGPEGWSVVESHGVHFRRPDGHLRLPIPTPDGSIDLLRPYANLSDRDFRLLGRLDGRRPPARRPLSDPGTLWSPRRRQDHAGPDRPAAH